MHQSPRSLFPSAIELGYAALITFTVILVGNAKLLLQQAHLIGGASIVTKQISTGVAHSVNLLSTFQFSASAIDMIIWGATGLVIYNFLQAIVRRLRMIAYQRELDSSYIHPRSFSRRMYWKHILSDAVLGSVLLASFIASSGLYLFVIIPTSLMYAQRFIVMPSLSTTFDLFVSMIVAFAGTVILYLLLKFVIGHHRITGYEE